VTEFASCNALYFPATHVEHGPPWGPDVPTLQVQFVKRELPAGESEFTGHTAHVESDAAPAAVEYLPAPQSLHSTSPVVFLYFPAKHGTHVTPLGPEYPVLQVQSVRVELASVDIECGGHDRHSD
jgi:hypothetical protein